MFVTVTTSHQAIYPAAAIVSTCWLTFYQTFKTVKARKRAGIEYPQMYADKAEAAASKDAMIFNCTQRAAQNTLEYLPAVIACPTTLIGYSKAPPSPMCGTWSLSRVIYTIGYSTGDPAKRNVYGVTAIQNSLWLGLICNSSVAIAHLALDNVFA
ncbi:uncharacterized protein B0H18DRAFT_1047304 [Fomitopsis serialis]|uniref:uncharacterized protein n=1 Tax=Fomitopsis serialis TaxID=139415 RepID=UPI002008B271|nr:uncharacterized protein B0H18DRAFT_1047304 [Neoantrodia serialis]KAH9913861.1 hypothetical protein B0H18DRAFT_1047304 [Neoantrodia serialis]